MKFILHEIKLWFHNPAYEPVSYTFLPDKVNVIRGDSSTGKTSIWSIIDYCLLGDRIKIPHDIAQNVSWFGIRFAIKDKPVCILRQSPRGDDGPSYTIYYGEEDAFPDIPKASREFSEVKQALDKEFAVGESLKRVWPQPKDQATSPLSYRHFLPFCSLTESVIGTPATYFDAPFYGGEGYEKELKEALKLAVGSENLPSLQATQELQETEKSLSNIKASLDKFSKQHKKLQKQTESLMQKAKNGGLLPLGIPIDATDISKALDEIEECIRRRENHTDHTELTLKLAALEEEKNTLSLQLASFTQYHKEYDRYKDHLGSTADSLLPIEFLKSKLADELLETGQTYLFLNSLEISLREIQRQLDIDIPVRVDYNVQNLRKEIKDMNKEIKAIEEQLHHKPTLYKRWVTAGYVEAVYEQLIEKRGKLKPVDPQKIPALRERKKRLKEEKREIEKTLSELGGELNRSIQSIFDQLRSLPGYSNNGMSISFNWEKMKLDLCSDDNPRVPIENIGSKSNYMFLHLCAYLGLHDHMLRNGINHVPQLLFIDQASIPYYMGNDQIGKDDQNKLIEAFRLLNNFVDDVRKDLGTTFQIVLIEHAPKEYWVEEKLHNFHTVAEFRNGGNKLIPRELIPTTDDTR